MRSGQVIFKKPFGAKKPKGPKQYSQIMLWLTWAWLSEIRIKKTKKQKQNKNQIRLLVRHATDE